MSRLEMTSALRVPGLDGWDIFGKKAKEKRKERLGLQAQTFANKMALQRYEQEKEAIETFRAKINTKMSEVEEAALAGTAAMEKARKLSTRPEFEGDPILEEFGTKVSELEQAIVQVQTGTVIDTATFDTHRLAISYSDAQAALIAMRSITNRAVELSTLLTNRLQEIERERRSRLERQRERAAQAEQERQRLAVARQELAAKAEEEARRRKIVEQRQVAAELVRLDGEIRREKSALAKAKKRLSDYKRSEAAKASRARSAAERAASRAAARSAARAG